MQRLARQVGSFVAGATLGGLITGAAEATYRGVELIYAMLLYGALWALLGLVAGLAVALLGRWVWRRPATADVGLSLALGLSGLVLVRFIVLRDVLAEAPSSRWLALGAGLFAAALLGVAGLAAAPLLRAFDRAPLRGYALAAAAIFAFVILSLRGDDPLPAQIAPATRPLRGEGVILVVVDTLRADALGAYGAPLHRGAPPSPRFDRFAASGLLFRDASAQASWTRPAVASLMTSRHASGHGTMAKNAMLPSTLPTIASELEAAHIRTGAVVTNYNLEEGYGFDRGFQEFRYLAPARYLGAPARANRLAAYNVYRLVRERFWRTGREVRHFYRSAQTVNALAFDMLDRMGDGRFFLWLHYMEPHDPYFSIEGRSFARVSDPRPAHESAAAMHDAYRDDVRRADAAFGELLDGLRERGLGERTTVILVADHGEEFGEHGGFYHGQTLYEEELHVPLAMQTPGAAPREVTSIARQIDIAPTVLGRFGVPSPASWEGHDLLGASVAPDVSLAEEDHEGNRLQSIRRGHHKLIVANPDNPRGLAPVERYDLSTDPHEQAPLSTSDSVAHELHGTLQAAVESARTGGAVAKTRELDAEAEAQLRALGYVH